MYGALSDDSYLNVRNSTHVVYELFDINEVLKEGRRNSNSI